MMTVGRVLRGARRFMARLGGDQRGLIALKFALALPAVTLLSVGAIDLTEVHGSKDRLQRIADSAALAGANDLALATDGSNAIERASSYVETHLTDWETAPTVTPDIQVLDVGGQRTIQVTLAANRASFFGNLLPPGGWNFTAQARASSVGLVPLCVLVTGSSGSKLLNVKNSGRVNAPSCLVHSNRDILVEGGSITASKVQAVTSAQGSISPTPGTGAAPVDDPFSGMDLNENHPCTDTGTAGAVMTGVTRLNPGVHCGGYIMAGDSQLILAPGEHWFLGGHLEVKENARLTGEDVVLFFNRQSKFDFKDHSTVHLEGRKTGAYAGMVMIATRANTQNFTISSDNVESLLGVIYVPEAQLIIEGKADVARDSAWTVIVARLVLLRGSPSLFVNANYGATDVPVPTGVGPQSGGSRLIQ